ncbi:VanW family protein [Bernardetia sp. OM2101]|uniref:VanW family protein n=1 Tax=Bernardetia sp. OM2101 TaxID=3344876 RepID=UPI0035D0D173
MKHWKAIKLYRRLIIRFITDLITRDFFRFAQKVDKEASFEYFISLSQEIKQSATLESKLYNFSVASHKINKYLIQPNEIFSFWNIIGNPNKQFRKGRTIQNGKITEDVGGGLCQVSGIIYYISLIAGLKILERHNHSVDIYNDETRFCPLGTDATLVYGYKDLRVVNTNSFPIKFEIQIIEQNILIKLLSTEEIKENTLEFKIEKQKEYTFVEIVTDSEKVVNISKYKNLC